MRAMRLCRSALLITVTLSACGANNSSPGGSGAAAGTSMTGTGGAAGDAIGTGTGGSTGGQSMGTGGAAGVTGAAGTTGAGGAGGGTAIAQPLCGICALDSECAAPNVCGRVSRTGEGGFCTPSNATTKCCAESGGLSVCFYADGSLNLPKLQCAAPVPAPASITDFSNVDSATGNFPISGALTGYLFALSPLSRDLSSGSLHVTGQASMGFGVFGVAFDCVDASRYSGITFKISGNAGPAGMLSVAANTEADTAREHGGTCYAEPSMCLPPGKNIAVGASPTTVSLAWADFAGGLPRATVDPTRIHAVVWGSLYASTTYAIDVTIDDLAFW